MSSTGVSSASKKDKVAQLKTTSSVDEFHERYQSFKSDDGPAIESEEIRHVFDFLDANHDGLISKDDLHQFLARLGFQTTEEEVASMVSSIDENGDGSVDFDEFASLYESFSSVDCQPGPDGKDECEEDLKDAFQVFDKNEDGVISPTELQEVLVNLGIHGGESLANCEKMIDNVDADHSGSVDFNEFKVLMSTDFGRG